MFFVAFYPESLYAVSMAENQYYFGIDGGGTYSRMTLKDRNKKVLAHSEGGSTSIYSVREEEVLNNLSCLLDTTLKTAGVNKQHLAAGCLGSAGLGRESDKRIYRKFFDTLLGPEFPVKLCSDAEILLCGGLENLEGFCLIAGTGSIAMGRSLDGTLYRSGGHGYMLGDEGSAAWIGKTAVARIFRSMEDRDLPTEMQAAILAAANLSSFDDFIHYVHLDANKVKIAALAPVVADAACRGDLLALDILHTGANELALLVESVIVRSSGTIRQALVMAGGIIENDEIITERLKEILLEQFPDLKLTLPKNTALEGACMLAENEFR